MSKLIRLSPTGIEYGDYAWNFASGCGNNIDGRCKSGGFKCWAYSISQRFEGHYPSGFKPTIYPDALLSPLYLKKPSRILCAFMGDLFWNCQEFNPDRVIDVKMSSGFIDHDTLRAWVFNAIQYSPQHTFLFLTKQPQNLPAWSPFPENCFVGVTATGYKAFNEALDYLKGIEAKVKYISMEPLLEAVPFYSERLAYCGINWLILGSQTKPYKPPRIEWVRGIVEACDKAGVEVFLKNNLQPLIPPATKYVPLLYKEYPSSIAGRAISLRQEVPNEN